MNFGGRAIQTTNFVPGVVTSVQNAEDGLFVAKTYATVAKPRYGRNIDVANLPSPGRKGDFPTVSLLDDEVDKGLNFCRPIHVDETTAKREMGYYASVFVDINMSQKIPYKIWVESKKHEEKMEEKEQETDQATTSGKNHENDVSVGQQNDPLVQTGGYKSDVQSKGVPETNVIEIADSMELAVVLPFTRG
ncbi:hypothetical protein FRX31_013237 [Thalictrum thalictroides]|uniref:Uncharacterized protein n=1 Tax=Thalictrum thalictroides TaxID=46969 RepID=A0A7J6WL57_THATH|nr:hypothetical protein FRX31_013237 [Thalictrum thalictroides]